MQKNEILKKYNLTPVETLRKPDGGLIRSFVIVTKKKSRNGTEKYFALKLFTSDDPIAKDRFMQEIDNIRCLRSHLPNTYKSFMPKIRWFSEKGDNPYYIYDYVEGRQLGKFVDDLGIVWGHFRDSNFPYFIEFFDAIADAASECKDLELGNWGYRVSIREVQHYFESTPGLLPSSLYDKVVAFIESSHIKAFKYKTISHRDLYPENILIKKKISTKFTFLDWEYLSEVPIGFDAAFLYLLFWREEYWKAKVFSHFYNKYLNDEDANSLRHFTLSFRYCLIILAIRFLYQMEAFGKAGNKITMHARNSFLYDLETSLSGEIVKPRNIKFFVRIEDIKTVADSYDIGEVIKYRIFYASKGNTVAKVTTDKGCYIFRFYSQSRSMSLILRELRIFEKLSDGGINTYDVIRTNKGRLYLSQKLYGKNRKIAVLSYLTGSRIKKRWANEDAIRQAGRMLRKIHDNNIIHGDYSKENILYKKGKLTGVIDFEWGRFTTSKEAKYSDLARAIALWIVDIRNKNIDDKELIKSFLKGYFKEFPKGKMADKILDLIIGKIDEERSISVTTIDKSNVRSLGKIHARFDNGIDAVKELQSSRTD